MTADLHASIARIARNAYESPQFHPAWEFPAADAITLLPEIRDGITAQQRLTAELERHRPVPYGEGSTTTVCTAGCGGHPCRTFLNLSGEPERSVVWDSQRPVPIGVTA